MAKSKEDVYKERLNKLQTEKERTLITVPDAEVSKDKESIVTDTGPKVAPWKGQRRYWTDFSRQIFTNFASLFIRRF